VIAQIVLELVQPFIEKPESWIGTNLVAGGAGLVQDGSGHVNFLLMRASGQPLDGRPVEIAGPEVEGGVVGVGAQLGLNQADRLQPVLPIGVIHSAQGADDVPHGDGSLALLLMLLLDGLLTRQTFSGELAVDPGQCRGLGLVGQSTQQLDLEGSAGGESQVRRQ